MIILENINYSIKNTPILKDINLRLDVGQVVALIGPNGAGKSTLFNVMSRIYPLQSGRVRFGDCDISTTNANALSKTLSMLTQENHVQGRLRVQELLLFGRYPYHQGRPTVQDEQKVWQVIEQFELVALADRFLSDLSGGQRQRALVAMSVCQDTPYLLLDEPLNNLDMYHTGQLMRLIRKLAEAGKTVVIVLHDLNQAAAFCDTIVMLKSGQIIHKGSPSEVITAQNIKALYNTDVQIIDCQGRPVVVDRL